MSAEKEKAVAEQLPIVAWRIKHPSEPGMIGHYPWTYTERDKATRRAGVDVESLTLHAPAQSALDELRREVEALRADAERYRWLRASANEDGPHVYGPDDDCIIDGEALDKVVDSAKEKALKGEQS